MLSNVLRCHVPARLYGTASPIFQHCASAALIHEWIPPSRKHFSTSRPVAAGAEYLCQQLEHRSVIRVAGRDASPFLQGIVTNNMQCLDGTLVKCVISSLYSMMLNAQGRVLYDLIIYRQKAEGEAVYLVECDKEVTTELLQTMKRYKIRKKVNLSIVGDECRVWAAFPKVWEDNLEFPSRNTGVDDMGDMPGSDNTEESKEESACCADDIKDDILLNDVDSVIAHSVDPRVRCFGHRLVLPAGVNGTSVVADSEAVQDQTVYHQRRYQLGLGEGTTDMPPGNCTPLESNAVFLNGVSFNKGCYVGQELTARTHHTGVIRKRLMPVVLAGQSNNNLQAGYKIENASGKNCGRFRAAVGMHGLALLRVEPVIAKNVALVIKDEEDNAVAELSTRIPGWWPINTDEVLKHALAKDSS